MSRRQVASWSLLVVCDAADDVFACKDPVLAVQEGMWIGCSIPPRRHAAALEVEVCLRPVVSGLELGYYEEAHKSVHLLVALLQLVEVHYLPGRAKGTGQHARLRLRQVVRRNIQGLVEVPLDICAVG